MPQQTQCELPCLARAGRIAEERFGDLRGFVPEGGVGLFAPRTNERGNAADETSSIMLCLLPAFAAAEQNWNRQPVCIEIDGVTIVSRLRQHLCGEGGI